MSVAKRKVFGAEFKAKVGICERGEETAEFFLSLPRPGDQAYGALLAGVEAFRTAHSGAAWRQAFLDRITGK